MESRFRFLRRSFCFLGGVLEYRKGICEVRIWFLRRGYWLVLLLFLWECNEVDFRSEEKDENWN